MRTSPTRHLSRVVVPVRGTVELRTLDTMDLRRADGTTIDSVVVQPKRFALLVFLADAAPRFCRRDTLMAMFWPELDTDRARGALRQALYFLRGALDEGVVIARGEEVAINADLLRYDVRALERAARDGDGALAVALHGEGYLPGFHASDVAPEFEQWVDAQRERLRDVAFRAARALVDECEAKRDYLAAVDWARRATSLRPDDEPAARRLIALLDRSGNRAGALSSYESFANRLATEQEVEPSIETRRLADAVRAREVPVELVEATVRAQRSVPQAIPISSRHPALARFRPAAAWYGLGVVAAAALAGVWMGWPREPSQRATQQGRAASENQSAAALYALGQRKWELRTDSSLRRAVDYYEQAIEKDPGYAAAYAGLAAAYAYLGTGNYADFPPREAGVRAKGAAQRAIALDDSLAEAHAVLGFVRMLYDYDFAGAEAAFNRAAALDPRSVRTALFRSIYLDWVGRFDDAVMEARRAINLDPRSVTASTEYARALFFAKRYDEALRELDRAKNLDSTVARIYLTRGEIYAARGDYPRAIAELSRNAGAQGRPPRTQSLLGLVLARSGDRTRAVQILDDLKARVRVGGTGAFDVATIYIGLGDLDEAFVWLERAYDDRSLRPFIMDPTFEEARKDPRMTALFKRMGLRTQP